MIASGEDTLKTVRSHISTDDYTRPPLGRNIFEKLAISPNLLFRLSTVSRGVIRESFPSPTIFSLTLQSISFAADGEASNPAQSRTGFPNTLV